MENLTGICKEKFMLWHFERNTPIEEYSNFSKLSETCKNALIIEFFNSAKYFMKQSFWDHFFYYEYRRTLFKDYNHSVSQSIEKCNEYYNETYGNKSL